MNWAYVITSLKSLYRHIVCDYFYYCSKIWREKKSIHFEFYSNKDLSEKILPPNIFFKSFFFFSCWNFTDSKQLKVFGYFRHRLLSKSVLFASLIQNIKQQFSKVFDDKKRVKMIKEGKNRGKSNFTFFDNFL